MLPDTPEEEIDKDSLSWTTRTLKIALGISVAVAVTASGALIAPAVMDDAPAVTCEEEESYRDNRVEVGEGFEVSLNRIEERTQDYGDGRISSDDMVRYIEQEQDTVDVLIIAWDSEQPPHESYNETHTYMRNALVHYDEALPLLKQGIRNTKAEPIEEGWKRFYDATSNITRSTDAIPDQKACER